MEDQAMALSGPSAKRGCCSVPPHTLPGPDKPTGVYDAGLKKASYWMEHNDSLKQESYFGNLTATEPLVSLLLFATVTNKEVLFPGSFMYFVPSLYRL